MLETWGAARLRGVKKAVSEADRLARRGRYLQNAFHFRADFVLDDFRAEGRAERGIQSCDGLFLADWLWVLGR